MARAVGTPPSLRVALTAALLGAVWMETAALGADLQPQTSDGAAAQVRADGSIDGEPNKEPATAPSARAAAPLTAARHVHAFYYLWYGNPATDGTWRHWDHAVLPHWTAAVRARYPEARFIPPHDVHAPFYPARGLYSSRDPATIRSHMDDMAAHGVGVAAVSWWGRPGVSVGDSQGVVTDALLPAVLDAAAGAGVAVALHLEPYHGRDIAAVREDLKYLAERYGSHPALFRLPRRHRSGDDGGAPLPVYYVYDSYHISASDWATLLAEAPAGAAADGGGSVRGTAADGVFIGLWLQDHHAEELAAGGFDGAYTYFAADGFSDGSTVGRWPSMAARAASLGLTFVPCVGPGYDDTRIRPWNAAHTRPRAGGQYYRRMWDAALAAASTATAATAAGIKEAGDANAGGAASGAAAARPQSYPLMVGVTSYNEFGEGTQVEAVVPRGIDVAALAPAGLALNATLRSALGLRDEYENYLPHGPGYYMELTAEYSQRLLNLLNQGATMDDRAQ
jgi:glycoprotein endo-alpha-1,2-mannosidase